MVCVQFICVTIMRRDVCALLLLKRRLSGVSGGSEGQYFCESVTCKTRIKSVISSFLMFQMFLTLGFPLWRNPVLQQGQRPRLFSRFHWSSCRSVLSMVWSYGSASVSSSTSLNSVKKSRSRASEALTRSSGSRSSIFSRTHTAAEVTHTHTHTCEGQWDGNQSITGWPPGSVDLPFELHFEKMECRSFLGTLGRLLM